MIRYSAFLVAVTMGAAEAPRIVYSKTFPGSTPAYIAITLERSGAGEYKEAPDDENPLEFQIKPKETDEIFALAEKLGKFTRKLESPAKVANMGMKAFRWEEGTVRNEVKFNFSEDLDARALHDWFERISESEQHLISLERTAKYEKLGVNRALLLLEAALARNRLVALDQYLPMLDRVAKNETYLNMARERARRLAEYIRTPPAEQAGANAAAAAPSSVSGNGSTQAPPQP
jgi:hypothetical protein